MKKLKRIVSLKLKHASRCSLKDEKKAIKKVMEVIRKHRNNSSQDEKDLGLHFVQVTMLGKNFVTLVDSRALNSFPSEKEMKLLKLSSFKFVNSVLKSLMEIFRDTLVKLSLWFGKMDLREALMDDHVMVLGMNFLLATQAIVNMDLYLLLILGRSIWGISQDLVFLLNCHLWVLFPFFFQDNVLFTYL